MDLGQMRRGVDMGPSAMRYAGINERLRNLKYEIEDLGDIPIGRPEVVNRSDTNLRNLELVAEKMKSWQHKLMKLLNQEHFR